MRDRPQQVWVTELEDGRWEVRAARAFYSPPVFKMEEVAMDYAREIAHGGGIQITRRSDQCQQR